MEELEEVAVKATPFQLEPVVPRCGGWRSSLGLIG